MSRAEHNRRRAERSASRALVQAVYDLPLSTPRPRCQWRTHSVFCGALPIESRWHSRPDNTQWAPVGNTAWQEHCRRKVSSVQQVESRSAGDRLEQKQSKTFLQQPSRCIFFISRWHDLSSYDDADVFSLKKHLPLLVT